MGKKEKGGITERERERKGANRKSEPVAVHRETAKRKEREKENARALHRCINLSLFCFACVIRGWGWMRRRRWSGGGCTSGGRGEDLHGRGRGSSAIYI